MEIIHPSPTDFNPDRMPRTVVGSTFVRAVNQAYHLRVLIGKLLTKGDQKIEELGQLEEERVEGESEDEDYVDLQKDLLEDVEKIKKSVKEHFNVCFKIGSMASFIITNNPETRMEEDKVKQKAQAALTK